jgi:hypothetical protein
MLLVVSVVGFTAIGARERAATPYCPVCPCPAPARPYCHAAVETDANGSRYAAPASYGSGPAQFQPAYGLNSAASTASTQTIAIVDAY